MNQKLENKAILLRERLTRTIGEKYTSFLNLRFLTSTDIKEYLVNYKPKMADVCHAVWNDDEILCIGIFNGHLSQFTDIIVSTEHKNMDLSKLILKFTIGDMQRFNISPPDYTLRHE